MIKAGSYIKSTAALKGSFFEDAIILIVENKADGAEGFVMNKPIGRSLHELEEFRHSQPFPIFEGGPVDPEHIYILHSRPDLIAGGQPMANGMHVGGSIQQVIDAINLIGVSKDEIKLFIGYCGWDAGELEMELQEGSWALLDKLPFV